MTIPPASPGGAIPSTTINALIAGVQAIALTGIIPTVTAPSSGSAAVSANGSVSFSNASNVSLNGCFSGQFDNYRIVWNMPSRSVNTTLDFRLRQAGTDNASASYNWARGYDSGTARTVGSATAGTTVPLDIATTAGAPSDGYLDLWGPAKGTYTSGTSLAVVFGGSPALPYTITTGFYAAISTPSDGFSLFPAATATLTGMLRVYGYNNLT